MSMQWQASGKQAKQNLGEKSLGNKGLSTRFRFRFRISTLFKSTANSKPIDDTRFTKSQARCRLYALEIHRDNAWQLLARGG